MKDQVNLRVMTKEDTSVTWRWRNQESVRDHFSGHPYSVTQEQEELWYDKSVEKNDSLVVFVVECKTDGQLLGMTFLKQINKIHRQAEFAILIAEENSGKGFGKEACRKSLEYAFKDLNLHRIYLKVRVDNPAAIQIYTQCGFRKEGELRDDVFKNEVFRNQYVMSILESEFPV